MDILFKITLVVASYLIGSVPFGLIFAKIFSGIDVRTYGSGNIGATNVLRSAGKKAALFTLLADIFKGLLIPFIAARLFYDDYTTAATGIAAILGHNFPIYLGFKGGKGVATSFGVILTVTPYSGIISLIAWPLAALAWRYSSLSALVAFAIYPFATFAIYPGSRPFGLLSLVVASLIYIRHRENIKRLLAGTEPKIGQK